MPPPTSPPLPLCAGPCSRNFSGTQPAALAGYNVHVNMGWGGPPAGGWASWGGRGFTSAWAGMGKWRAGRYDVMFARAWDWRAGWGEGGQLLNECQCQPLCGRPACTTGPPITLPPASGLIKPHTQGPPHTHLLMHTPKRMRGLWALMIRHSFPPPPTHNHVHALVLPSVGET